MRGGGGGEGGGGGVWVRERWGGYREREKIHAYEINASDRIYVTGFTHVLAD